MKEKTGGTMKMHLMISPTLAFTAQCDECDADAIEQALTPQLASVEFAISGWRVRGVELLCPSCVDNNDEGAK